MKTISSPLAIIITALCLASCNSQDVRMTTIIKADGHCRREVTYRNIVPESEQDNYERHFAAAPQCLAVDSMMSYHFDVDGDTCLSTFSQLYNTVEDMSAHTPLRINGMPVKSSARLEKKFRWFYTEYTFTETFASMAGKFEKLPTDHASVDEVSYYFTGHPNLVAGMNGAEASCLIGKIEPKITRWANENLTVIVIDAIASHYDEVVNPPVSKEVFVNMGDSLTDYLMKHIEDPLTGDQNAQRLFRAFFHSDAYAPLLEDSHPCAEEIQRKASAMMEVFTFSVPYVLKMPGRVTDPGRGAITADGSVCYPLTGDRLIPQDYVITATSRETCVWAWCISVLVLIVAIASFVMGRKKR